MGAFKMFSSSFNDSRNSNDASYYQTPDYKNPNPFVFTILKKFQRGNIFLLEVKYPNCTNFEGHKIIVISLEDYNKAIESKKLDPHFSDEGQTVIARFEPTEKGWKLAKEFIEKCNI